MGAVTYLVIVVVIALAVVFLATINVRREFRRPARPFGRHRG